MYRFSKVSYVFVTKKNKITKLLDLTIVYPVTLFLNQRKIIYITRTHYQFQRHIKAKQFLG